MSGVGTDNVNCAAAHPFYNGHLRPQRTTATALLWYPGPALFEGVPRGGVRTVQDFCLVLVFQLPSRRLAHTDEQIKKIAEVGVPVISSTTLLATVTPGRYFPCSYRSG